MDTCQAWHHLALAKIPTPSSCSMEIIDFWSKQLVSRDDHLGFC